MTEVVGFILSFALSAVFLLISMNTFFLAQSNSDEIVTAAELRTIAERIASHVVEAGLLGQEFPLAVYNTTISIPQSLNDHPYTIEARPWAVYANTTDSSLSASATTFKLEAITSFEVDGLVYSGNERVVITYSQRPSTGAPSIHVHGGVS